MNREQQIKEMEQIGSNRPCNSEDCSKCLAMNRRCNDFLFAERLYNAGYRKIPEGAMILTKEELAVLKVYGKRSNVGGRK